MTVVKGAKLKWTHRDGNVMYYPIAEATEELYFAVTDKDIAKAKGLKGYADPNSCVAACAARRQFTDSIFQRDTAYTLQIHGGVTHAVRYRLGGALRRAIAEFDATGKFATGMYKLLPPTASQTLEAKRLRASQPAKTSRKVRPHVKFSARGRVTPMS